MVKSVKMIRVGKRVFLWMICMLLLQGAAVAQVATNRYWQAAWVTHPEAQNETYGCYLFRTSIQLEKLPERYLVAVSGDPRYKLYVNGKEVVEGPASSDRTHWNYDVIDLQKWLRVGENEVVARLLNEGKARGLAQMSHRPAFILEDCTQQERGLSTGAGWRCIKDEGYDQHPFKISKMRYFVAGAGEAITVAKNIKRTASGHYDDAAWLPVTVLRKGMPTTIVGPDKSADWLLQPSPLPLRSTTKERLQRVRQSEGVTPSSRWLQGDEMLLIPPHTKATILLDQNYLTNAFFSVKSDKGRGAKLTIGYQESLYDEFPRKGHRDEVAGKTFIGREDCILTDGTPYHFTSFTYRTYRYVQLTIETADEPLFIGDLYGEKTGYPFTLRAELKSADEELQTLFSIGWRTAQLCAVDTYMDCPYYERLQYLGDTRIQALITLYMTGDDRLVKNFLTQADLSRTPEGVTQSRYPSSASQYIPPYAVSYICALHDFLRYGDDPAFVEKKLMGVRSILAYYEQFRRSDGTFAPLPFWNFTDWVEQAPHWHRGIPACEENESTSVMDLQILMGYIAAAELEEAVGMPAMAALYRAKAEELRRVIRQTYWREERGLFCDLSLQGGYSQHANALAILTEVVVGDEAHRLAEKIEQDHELVQATIYFKYYTHAAMVKAGLGDRYLTWLDNWRENIALGLTTWCEYSDTQTSRSDCHAWGASPNIEFFRTLLGIDSAAPSFARVHIAPHLGNQRSIGGRMPHPKGEIAVQYELRERELKATVSLPEEVTGEFVWQGETYPLTAGENRLKITNKK